MAVAIVVGAAGSGRWVARAGARNSMVTGCVVSAAGILLTRHYLSAHPPFTPLALASRWPAPGSASPWCP